MLRTTSRLGALILAVAVPASVASAQRPTGGVEGIVTDSIHHRPLVGATVIATPPDVQLDSAFHAAATDARGRFHIAGLPPGSYTISVEHPFIDSTGIGARAVEVAVPDGRVATVALAIPSSLTLRRALCPISVRDSLIGMMLGVVRRTDGSTVPQATVVFTWGDFDIDHETAVVTPQQLTANVITDSVGVYRACGLPMTRPLSVQAQSGTSEHSGIIEEEIGESGVRVLDLRLGRASADPVPAVAAPDITATETTLPPARYLLIGRVQEASGKPISSAHVRLFGTTLEATTNEKGEFRLAGLPDGTQGLEIVALAYAPRRVSVDVGGDSREVTVTLDRSSVVLDSILVTARRASRSRSKAYRDFDERAKRGSNRYFTEEEIARRRPFYTSDLLRMVPGVRVIRRGFDIAIISNRSSLGWRSRDCPLAIYLDGMAVGPRDIADLPPQFLHGVEVVSSSVGAPPGYLVGSCGAVFIWSK
jgi:hypothetical protein